MTFATETPKNLQGWFDNAWQHAVVEKNPPAVGPNGQTCVYRTYDNTNGCLIGRSIPSEKYSTRLENRTADELPLSVLSDLSDSDDWSQEQIELATNLKRLQRCHDAISPAAFGISIDYSHQVEINLRHYAFEQKLTILGEIVIDRPAEDMLE